MLYCVRGCTCKVEIVKLIKMDGTAEEVRVYCSRNNIKFVEVAMLNPPGRPTPQEVPLVAQPDMKIWMEYESGDGVQLLRANWCGAGDNLPRFLALGGTGEQGCKFGPPSLGAGLCELSIRRLGACGRRVRLRMHAMQWQA